MLFKDLPDKVKNDIVNHKLVTKVIKTGKDRITKYHIHLSNGLKHVYIYSDSSSLIFSYVSRPWRRYGRSRRS